MFSLKAITNGNLREEYENLCEDRLYKYKNGAFFFASQQLQIL
jgi:hypothetical protein